MGILSVFCIYDTIGTDVNIVSKNTCFYKIIHFSMQFSAILNLFIVKT